MNKILLSFAVISIWAVKLNAQIFPSLGDERAGISIMSALKIGVGARATAMSEAFVAVADDATDDTAAIKHELQISLAGEAVVSTGLSLESAATDGVVIERLTSAETTDMPIDTLLTGDLQLIDANGEILTWVFTETLKTVPAATNRAPS